MNSENEKAWNKIYGEKQPSTAIPIKPVVSRINTTSKAIRELVMLVFGNAIALGAFIQLHPEKTKDSYKILIDAIKAQDVNDEVKKLIDSLSC